MFFSSSVLSNSKKWKSQEIELQYNSIYEMPAKLITGEDILLSQFKGQVLIVVNVASEWGKTHTNYTQFVELYEEYSGRGLSILAFPCNQFGNQEPGTNQDIYNFAVQKYNVQFPMFGKVNVNGSRAHPLFLYLRKNLPGTLGQAIKWNFTKFLISREGVPIKRYATYTDPRQLEPDILRLL